MQPGHQGWPNIFPHTKFPISQHYLSYSLSLTMPQTLHYDIFVTWAILSTISYNNLMKQVLKLIRAYLDQRLLLQISSQNHIFFDSLRYIMQRQFKERVIIIGAGLSGLSAAYEILKKRPGIQVTVLEAMDRVGGRTSTVQLNGFKFDVGAQFIGKTQKYVQDLAKESGNDLIDVFHHGTKIIQMQNKVFTYQSDIPNNLSIMGLIKFQILIWKINRMAQKVPLLDPKQCQSAFHWDSITVQDWMNENTSHDRLKIMMEIAVRSIFGAEMNQISFLFFLWYVRQHNDFQNLINIQNGLQEMKTKLGTQHFSNYLTKRIEDLGGKVLLGKFVQKIQQDTQKCVVFTKKNEVLQSDYLIMAIPPWQANKINFIPKLSINRQIICSRNVPGSYLKVLLLYDKTYWKQKRFSGQFLTDCKDSPLMTAFDDTKINHQGKIQPALIVFLGGKIQRFWTDQKEFQQRLAQKIAEILNEPGIRPIKIHYKVWEKEASIGGGPVGIFSTGVLTQIEDLRRPQHLIHWAGTELASISTGYMDGAIQSGLRAAKEVLLRYSQDKHIQNLTKSTQNKKEAEVKWYRHHLNNTKKFFEWF